LVARDVIDAVVPAIGREVPGSVTDQVSLLGADRPAAVQPAAGRLAEDYRVTRSSVEHRLSRYGMLATEVLDLIRANPELAHPLAQEHPYLRAKVAYAVTHEAALHLEDVLMRRTRLVHRLGRLGRRGGRRGSDHGAPARLEPATSHGRSAE
jgi:glycerol-3-phosphate dehydrogenase